MKELFSSTLPIIKKISISMNNHLTEVVEIDDYLLIGNHHLNLGN